jgi:hypothetical protein
MDPEQRQHLEGLRQIYRKRLRTLEQQVATFGLQIPSHILIEVDEVRSKIAELDSQISEIEQPLPIPTAATTTTPIRERVEALFRDALHYKLTGDPAYALQLFQQLQQLDPAYPRIDVNIRELERELRRPYVGDDGRVISRLVRGNHNAIARDHGHATVIDNRVTHQYPKPNRVLGFFKFIGAIILLVLGTVIHSLFFQNFLGPFLFEQHFHVHIGMSWAVVGAIIGVVNMVALLMGVKPR